MLHKQESKTNPIYVCGCGPGNPDYIYNKVFKLVEQADCLAGGKRMFEYFETESKELIPLTSNIESFAEELKKRGEKKVVVLVSGDTGFYSLFTSLKRYIPKKELIAEPGISSFQYMFAKLGLSYEQASLCSVHGLEIDLAEQLKNNKSLFLLTDNKTNVLSISQQLINLGKADTIMHIGSRLSYNDEIILSGTAQEFFNNEKNYPLCSIIIG